MNKLELIENILKDEDTALHYKTIQEIYNTKYQQQITIKQINSILSNEINKNKKVSLFIRLKLGIYGLRSWLHTKNHLYKEYTSKRINTDYLDEYIAVIDANLLKKLIPHHGITEKKIDGVLLSSLCQSMYRRIAEKTIDYIQLVTVFLIYHEDKILTFSRTKALPEKRLRNTLSINFGGHISYKEANDIFNQFDIDDPNSLVSRELDEEILINCKYKIKQVGYLYDNSNDMGLQHLGLFHTVKLSNRDINILEKKFFIKESFKTTNEIRDSFTPDYWTNCLLSYFEKHH